MTDFISVTKINEVYLKLDVSTDGIDYELSDFFKFRVPGFQYMPRYKAGVWDGFKRLYDLRYKKLYSGLITYIQLFCQERGYELRLDKDTSKLLKPNRFTQEDVQNFLNRLSLPFDARDYQMEAVRHCLGSKRALLLSATGSGKSLMIYTLARIFTHLDLKTLIVVPTVSLVSQMTSDFKDYSKNIDWDTESHVHNIFAGKSHETEKPIVISTWQSIHGNPKKWFDQFQAVIFDEVHKAKADCSVSMMENLTNTKFRIGTTGTISETKVHKLVLEGLFGPVTNIVKTKELMDRGELSELKIEALVLRYPDDVKRSMKKATYREEIDFLNSHRKRNKLIGSLGLSLNSNALILFREVENHGKILFDYILEKADPNRKVFFVHGGVDAESREKVRQITEKEKNAIIVASYGVFSTGVNIKNLYHVICASPTKSRITLLQTIGRGLRLGDDSDKITVWDIVDDLTIRSHKNFSYQHFYDRVKVYNEEKFNYSIKEIPI